MDLNKFQEDSTQTLAMEHLTNSFKDPDTMDDPEQAELVLSNKGGPKLINNGFMYTMHKKQTNNIRWRCVLRSSHCRGSLVTSIDYKMPKVRMEHNHEADDDACSLARTRYVAMGQPTVLPDETPNAMYEAIPLPIKNTIDNIDNLKDEPAEEVPEVQEPVSINVVNAQPIIAELKKEASPEVMQPGSPGTSAGRTIRLATQSLIRQPLRSIAPAPLTQHHSQQPPKTLVLKTIPLKIKQVAPTTIKMTPRHVSSPQTIIPQQPTEVCLRWNSYHSNMQNSFPSLLDTEQFVDVTLACEGRSLKCHKMILSSCSDYLAALLRENPCQHPIILMKDLKFWEIEALVKFMYRGEVNVAHDKLPQLLNAAEALQIKGLAGPSPSLQNPKPPTVVPQSKPLNQSSVAPTTRVVNEPKETNKASVSSATPAVASDSPKRVPKRQSSEPPQPRAFTKIRLQRPVTPTSPNLTVKLEPLDIPLSPTEIFPEHHHHHDEDSSTASNFDNLVMALHEDEDPGGEDRCSDDGDLNFCDLPRRSDDLNDNEEQMEFVPTDFLEQEQDIVEEADGEFSKSSNDDSDDDDDEDDDEEMDEEDDDELEDTKPPPLDDGKKSNIDDRGNDKRTEKCTNYNKTL